MTKRLMAAVLCATAMFAIGGVATAQAQGLSYRNAKSLAKKLAEKQVKGRDVVSFHLLKAKRLSSTRIAFPYDDRSADNVFCTAALIVDETVTAKKTTFRARFAGQRCRGIPAEVLKFEAITRQAQRDLRTNTPATLNALAVVKSSSKACRNVRVPKKAAASTKALFDIALVEALERPNDTVLNVFSFSLLLADASNPTLHTGAVAWADYLTTVRALPPVPDPCAAVKQWAAANFAASAAPIDFAAYAVLDKRAGADRKAIGEAADLLARDGAFPNAALGFTPDGLLLQLAAKSGITGGKGKLLLG